MKPSFLHHDKPILTVMIQTHDPEHAIELAKKAIPAGADAFGLQVCQLPLEYHNPETYQRIFAAMEGKPVYVTNYRHTANDGKTDEEIGEGLVELARSGATLCDVIGDMFCPDPEQLTMDPEAVKKQMHLIDRIHEAGGEVLISSHVMKFIPAERVLEIAREQVRRGADVVKIVTSADTMEQQIENLRIKQLLKQEIDAPILFLSGGTCKIHRRMGIFTGNDLCLCVYEHDELSTKAQPLLASMKAIQNEFAEE